MKSKRYLFQHTAFVIACMISIICFCQNSYAETKTVNISLSTSTGVYETATLQQKGDKVEYVLTTNDESSSYNIKLEPDSHYCELRVFDSKMQPLFIRTYYSIGECHFKLRANATYYFDITLISEAATTFNFWMEQVPDASDTRAGAEAVDFDVVKEAAFSSDCYGAQYDLSQHDVDYFRFKTDSYKRNYTINAWAITGGMDMDVYLLNADGTTLKRVAGVGTSGYPFSLALDANTTYYLRFIPRYYGNWSYGFKVTTGSIIKVGQTIKGSPLSKSISYSKLKSASQSFTLKLTAKTTPSCKKVSGNSKITVSSSGKITVKKGLKKGTYTVKVKITAPSSKRYNSATKTVSVKITVH